MKIALFHNSKLPPKTYGGIERIVVTLAREYRRRGHQAVVVCREGSQLGDEQITVPENFSGADLEKVLPRDVDFIHSHQPLPLEPKKPFLVTIHGNGHPEEKYFSNTNFLSQSHARNHNAKYFIYNGVELSHYPFNEKKEDYFVFLARTTWRVKNVRTAIQWATDLGVRLEIMGGSGISRGNIHYNGLVDEDAKIKLIARARALIYPTNWDEPCAAAPLEALACGTPVITSKNGCMPELVKAGCGFVCENFDDLLVAGRNINSISPQACRENVETNFSLQRMTDDYLELFGKIMKVGKLDQTPHFNFTPASVHYLFKPTLVNRLQFALRGKI